MPFHLVAYSNRTKDFTITIKDPSGDYVKLKVEDVVRVKFHRTGTTLLDIDNKENTSNGSFTRVDELGNGQSVHARATLRLMQGDLEGKSGMYGLEISVVDYSDSSLIKTVDFGSIEIIESPDGDIGID